MKYMLLTVSISAIAYSAYMIVGFLQIPGILTYNEKLYFLASIILLITGIVIVLAAIKKIRNNKTRRFRKIKRKSNWV